MKPLDVARVPLHHGTALIEASAGTGKTYSIAALFLRLILEERLPLQSIVAVTYTVAATQELKERIRQRLRDGLHALRASPPDPGDDPVLAAFLEGREEADLAPARAALELAAASFDEAQIFTIHGFCQRVLQEYAFETGMRHGAETVQDASPLYNEVAHDLWRRLFYDAHPLPAALVLNRRLAPERWSRLLQTTANHPNLRLVPEASALPFKQLESDLITRWNGLLDLWNGCESELSALLLESRDLRRTKDAFREDHLHGLLASLRRACALAPEVDPATPAVPAFFASSFIATQLKKGKSAPQHPFFDLCEQFCNGVRDYFFQIDHTLLAYADDELSRRKRERHQLTFDDLLNLLHRALIGPMGERLTQRLRERYQVALVDEFQDTDPLQAAIFTRLFSGPGLRLFLIGDPKQAIYGFRGADVFAYIAAAKQADHQYNLAVNWRSDAALLDGFNALFGISPAPFIIEDIGYLPVHAPEGQQPPPLPGPPLLLRSLRNRGDKTLNKETGIAQVCAALAREIAALAASGPWRVGEMAVLVRNHAQAEAVRNALRRAGVRSVLHSRENVLKSVQAVDLQRFLEAVIQPRREDRLRTALATSFFGYDTAAFAALEEDEALLERWFESFSAWHELWLEHGFIAMFRRALVDENIRQRLISMPDGERQVTDLLHLAELLHQQETEEKLAPEALCNWLHRQRHEGGNASDAAQLRLESDAEALTIVTIHKSKGLEYPVVFCPFLWIPDDSPYHDTIFFHGADGVMTHDLRKRKEAPEAHVETHRRETLAEEARLLYVALTRAQHRCTLYTCDYRDAASSALAHLVREAGGDLPTALEALAKAHPGSIGFEWIEPDAPDAPELPPVVAPEPEPAAARCFGGDLSTHASWIASFTSLAAASHGGAKPVIEVVETREVEAVAELPPPETGSDVAPLAVDPDPYPISRFERGIRAGDFFHELLEALDFRNPEQLERLLPEKLAEYGLAPSPFEATLRKTLLAALEVELEPGLRLNQISRGERLSETPFTLRLPALSSRRLVALFRQHDVPTLQPPDLGRLRFSPIDGFLRGSIDLLFRHEGRYYLLDWKSNWLGDRPQAYDPPGLLAAMKHHLYGLQAHLYLLAVDRFLAARLPGYDYERDFGGLFYLFLRGVDRENPARGIYRERPPLALVESLRQLSLP
ncbi:MAG TPA: exodeoxyribonuclease V subunit beta [Chthoniobacteraceae bacterium]|nr:exodeoxyribonuclease V subunit beta [Chthoniobacteraceae bacterium]